LATSFILYERIKTTQAKAKELKPIVERLINKSRSADLSARRRLLGYLFDENATKKVIEVIVPRLKDKKTGFIKSYNLTPRLGDGAKMMILELELGPEENNIKDKELKENGKENKTTRKEVAKKPKAATAKSAK
jgi:large subunit ribosomal protein L17